MLLKAHEVMTHDRPIKYLSRQSLKVHTHGRRGFKVRLPQDLFDSVATAMERLVVDLEPSQGARNLVQQWDKLAKIRDELELSKTAVRDQ